MCLNCESGVSRGRDQVPLLAEPAERRSASRTSTGARVLASSAAGAVAIPAMRIANWPDKAYSEKVIRPPGAVEEREFLERCIRCAECMKVCPNNALHPAFFEAGLEGLWTPILIPRIGYCEFSCVLCGQVCPTGAIQKITEKQKMGIGQKPITHGHRDVRPRALPALGDGHAVHRLRGVLPDLAQGDLGRRGRGPEAREPLRREGRAGQDDHDQGAASRTSIRRSASAAAPARRCAPSWTSPPCTSRTPARRAPRPT